LDNPVSLRRDGNVAIITIDNPPVNALRHGVRKGILDCVTAARDDASVEAIVLTGAGRTFVAGADITEFGKPPTEPSLHSVLDLIEKCPKPVVAAIHGTALGGGLEVTLACHYRVGVKGARFGLPEVKLGLLPGAGGTQRLPRVVGPARARELILTGKVLTAAEAERIGLVHEVVPAGEAVARATAIGEEIALRGPLAVREAKRLIDLATETDIDAGLAAELDASDRIFATDDMLEGAASFFGKRDPEYRGR
jgi:3-hydroxyacyl-CoA dehydrogenase